MLLELRIKNFVIVDSLTVEFREGFNVVTGETGAGKSILVNAIELLLGARGSQELVRPDSKEAVVEAVMIINEDLQGLLQEMGIPPDEHLVIRRIISQAGKSRVYINDTLATLQSLQKVTTGLVDMHGQHEHQSLFKTASQMQLLDAYAGTEPLRSRVESLYREYVSLQKRLRDIMDMQRQRQQRMDMLEYQIAEIDRAELKRDELEQLLAERKMLQNLTQLRQLTEEAILGLKERDGSVLSELAGIISALQQLTGLDSEGSEVLKLLQDAETLLQEASYQLRELRERYDCDPGRLDEVERRLQTIEKLRKKYGDTIEDILGYRDDAERELKELQGLEEQTADIEERLRQIEAELHRLADELSVKRKEAAEALEKEVVSILKKLAFNSPVFRIQLKDAPLSGSGKDAIEFVFSANPGFPERPLSKVASGGEISRVMLAIKTALASYDKVPILVFDEIDAGIGGRTAESVGRMLRSLAENRQVICITHLPQIAARAEHHLLVEKTVSAGQTTVHINTLGQQQRLHELARMLSGSVTDTSVKHARELLSVSSEC